MTEDLYKILAMDTFATTNHIGDSINVVPLNTAGAVLYAIDKKYKEVCRINRKILREATRLREELEKIKLERKEQS